ncbi:flagellin [Campylobacter porcelli]|uniref:Flagellar secreted protein n=1 Tax=Campylobacter porcelli TaxID=1660073 RepID=A0A1X9SX25_9BACT|nr:MULTISPECIES: flagellin [unclassified Campylobacter]ARR00828.1 flagellar secreted protein [Campylobacter sp. RM6137]
MKINDYSNSMQNYYLNNAQNSANKALDNISANRAISGSDSANMVIANALLSNANAISQGVSNANDAIGVLQIADGALQNLTSGADRLNELSIRSTSLAMDSNARSAITSEAEALKTSMQDTLNSTSFNGNNIFGSTLNFQTGNSETRISLNAPNISSIDINSQDSIAAFRDSVNAMRTDIGSTQQGLLSNINSSITAANSARASESQLQNNDVVKNLSDLNRSNLQINSTTLAAAHNMSLLAQQVSSLLR